MVLTLADFNFRGEEEERGKMGGGGVEGLPG